MPENSIEQLELSTRTKNLLHRIGIHSIEDFNSIKIDELQGRNGIGRKAISEIEKQLLIQSETVDDPRRTEYYKMLRSEIKNFLDIDVINLIHIVEQSGKKEAVEQGGFDVISPTNIEALLLIPHIKAELEKYLKNIIQTTKKPTNYKMHSKIKNNFGEIAGEEVWSIFEKSKVWTTLGNQLVISRPSLEQFIEKKQEEKPMDKNFVIFMERLKGKTLQAVGDKYYLTRERIRQKLVEYVNSLPLMMEDYYKKVFSSYKFSKKLFLDIFSECKPEVYEYLSMRYKKGKVELNKWTCDGYDGIFEEKIKEYFVN